MFRTLLFALLAIEVALLWVAQTLIRPAHVQPLLHDIVTGMQTATVIGLALLALFGSHLWARMAAGLIALGPLVLGGLCVMLLSAVSCEIKC